MQKVDFFQHLILGGKRQKRQKYTGGQVEPP